MAGPQTDEAEVRTDLEVLKQVQRDFEARNKLHQELDDVMYMKKKPRVPRGFPNTTRVQSPLAPHIVNTITAALSMNPYKVLFDPVSIGPSGEQNASLREHFFNASWHRNEQERRRRVFRTWMHSLVGKGEAVFKTVERSKTLWAGYDKKSGQLSKDLKNPDHPDYGEIAQAYNSGNSSEHDRIYNARTEEMKREYPYPISTIDIPPSTFYYIKGEEGFTYCAEEKVVPYYATLEKYESKVGMSRDGKIVPSGMGLPQEKWADAMSGGRSLTMYEIWKWDRCRYILCGPGDDVKKGEGRMIKTFKHRYGIRDTRTLRGPYFHAFGITTSSRENHLMGLSVLFGFLKLFPWLDELLTIQGAAAWQYGYPRYGMVNGGEAPDGVRAGAFSKDAMDRMDKEPLIEPGAILPWNVKPVDAPSSGPDLGEAIKICRDLLELALPSIVQGAVDGTESGYLAAQATHLARLIWQPIVDNAEFCCAERTAFESWLIDKEIAEDVYVWGEEAIRPGLKRRKPRMMWLGIGPDDIKGVHAYKCKLEPSTPSQDVIKVRTHDEMLKLKLETLSMARADMGFNPDEVEMGWLLDEAKAQLLPDVLAAIKQKITAKQTEQANRANEAEALATKGAGGPFNGRAGAMDTIQPGQEGEPIQPTPEGQAGTTDVSATGGISSEGGGTPVVPSPAPPGQAVPA